MYTCRRQLRMFVFNYLLFVLHRISDAQNVCIINRYGKNIQIQKNVTLKTNVTNGITSNKITMITIYYSELNKIVTVFDKKRTDVPTYKRIALLNNYFYTNFYLN